MHQHRRALVGDWPAEIPADLLGLANTRHWRLLSAMAAPTGGRISRRLGPLNGRAPAPGRGGLVRVAGAVSSGHLRRWLVAIVMIVGVAATGRSAPSAPAAAGSDPRAADMAATVSGWSGSHGIVPVQPKVEAASTYERGVRVKLPVLIGAVAAALLGAVVPHRSGFRRRQQSSRLPLALRARPLRQRAPPLLPLG